MLTELNKQTNDNNNMESQQQHEDMTKDEHIQQEEEEDKDDQEDIDVEDDEDEDDEDDEDDEEEYRIQDMTVVPTVTQQQQQQLLQQQLIQQQQQQSLLSQDALFVANLLSLQQQQQQVQIPQSNMTIGATPPNLLYPGLTAATLAATSPIHNLIPLHLQPMAIAASLNGTPGYQPALIPHYMEAPPPVVYTVQDRPLVPPVYNGVNPNYPGLALLHSNPPVFCVDNFLTPFECDFLISAASDSFGPAPVVGKGAGEISPSRTSSTCYLAREDLPDYLRKVSLLTGKPIHHCELPQVGRYLPSQQYLQHFDAFDLSNEDGRRFAANGGQRTVTVLVYLNDVCRGGGTSFPALNLEVRPRRGMALIFFPATVDGLLDKNALHAALPAVDTKFVSQVWIRQNEYKGEPSKRLSHTLGMPFSQPQQQQQPAASDNNKNGLVVV